MVRAVGKSWGSMGLPSLGLPSKAEDMVKITRFIIFANNFSPKIKAVKMYDKKNPYFRH